MPTYQYACTSCGHALEAQQSFTDEPLTVCPECEGRLRKVFSAVGVVFKGSGFYRTDSRGGQNGSGSGAGDGKGDSKGGDGKGQGKSKDGAAAPAKETANGANGSSGSGASAKAATTKEPAA